MVQRLRIQQYDNGIRLIFTVKRDGLVESIQGATVILKLICEEADLILSRTCTITDGNAGECEYTLLREDLQVVGEYTSEVETRFPNGTVLSVVNPLLLTVYEEEN